MSHSARETYLTCPRKYFLHYFLKLRPIRPRSPLVFGSAIDEGLNCLLETRDIERASMAFGEKWFSYRDKDVAYSKSDHDEFLLDNTDKPDDTWLSLSRRGIILLQEYDRQIMPKIKEVIKVQLDQTATNSMGDELVIKTDCIVVWEDGRRILFDNKTSSMKYTEDSVRISPQLAIYYETLKEEYNLDACGYIIIPKKINKIKEPRVKIEVIIDQVSQETLNATLESYDETLKNIKNAKFECNKSSCKGIYGLCDFYKYCHQGDITGLVEKKEKYY